MAKKNKRWQYLLKVQQLERHLGGGDGDDRRVAALRTLVTTQVGPL